ncbi:MAG: MerR family transcriptional regulator [Coprococcus sp.]
MAETRYIISDAAKMINVEPHVLRYWEEELAIEIPRNELGHRYYTEKEIQLFENIRDLKEKGFQLKAIKLIITTLNEDAPFEKKEDVEEEPVLEEELAAVQPVKEKMSTKDGENSKENETSEGSGQINTIQTGIQAAGISSEDKMKHFKYIMDAIVTEALQNNNLRLEDAMAVQVTDVVMQELGRMEERQEQQSERYYKLLDETIRGKQRAVQEVAAAKVPSYAVPKAPRRKRGLFKKHYKY